MVRVLEGRWCLGFRGSGVLWLKPEPGRAVRTPRVKWAEAASEWQQGQSLPLKAPVETALLFLPLSHGP